MATTRTRLLHACVFQVFYLIFNMVVAHEYLALDKNLTRQEITTPLGHPVNLGCYVTKTGNSSQSLSTPVPSSLVYNWKKDNVTVTQSSSARIHQNVLVVTPESDEDFGAYECNVTNGVSNARCRILLIRGWKSKPAGGKGKPDTAGCVNISVLMPVLAVAVLSALLFVHLVIRRKEPKILTQKRRRSTIGLDHPHAEQRRKSRSLLYDAFDEETANNNEKKQDIVSTEMHATNDYTSLPNPQEVNPSDERRRERRSGFCNKTFRELSLEMDDAEIGSQASEESKTSNDKNGFYNKPFKNDSIDESDGEVFSQTSEEAVGVDKPKKGKGKGFPIKSCHSESMDLNVGDPVASAGGSIVSAVMGGKAAEFSSQGFKTETVDVHSEKDKAPGAEEPIYKDIPIVDTYF